MIERIRPILSGNIEYKVTAEDPKALAKPYTRAITSVRRTEIVMDNWQAEDGE